MVSRASRGDVYVVRVPVTVALDSIAGRATSGVHQSTMIFRVEALGPEDAAQRLAKILGGQESYRLEDGVYRR